MKNYLIAGCIGTLAFGGAIGYFFGYDQGFERAEENGISSFEECAAAGYPIMESYPEQCATPDGKHFTRVIEEPVEEEESLPPKNERPPLPPEYHACPMDVKGCPDGSYVGRTGPSCEFAPCPGE